MKKSMQIGLIVLACILTTESQAGDARGNGGGGVICKANGKINVQLLDFWEGETLKGLKIKKSQSPVSQQIGAALQALIDKGQIAYSGYLGNYAGEFYTNVEVKGEGFLPQGVSIEPPRDALNKFIKTGCELGGIALFDDEYKILDVDRELYEALSPTDKAGLFVHETIYRVLRERFHVTDSVVARNLTACVFSETPCPELSAVFGIPGDVPLYLCRLEKDSNYGSLYLYQPKSEWKNQKDNWRFQLSEVKYKEEPTARSYFDPHVVLDVRQDGYLVGRPFAGFKPTTLWTKSSEERWRNIGLPMPFLLDFDVDGFPTINNKRVRCFEQ
jgi:hypothetical protein